MPTLQKLKLSYKQINTFKMLNSDVLENIEMLFKFITNFKLIFQKLFFI